MRLVKYRGVWCAYIQRGNRRSLGTTDRALAEQRIKDWEKDLLKKRTTINDIVEAYLKEKKDKPSIRSMQDCWSTKKEPNRPLKAFFGNLRPDQVSKVLCRDYAQRRLDNDVSNGTIRKELGILRQAIRWNDPSAPIVVELTPSAPPKERYLTKEEYKTLLAACERPYLRLFVQLALGTAARKTAILELTWDRVDLDRARIVLSKGRDTNKGRATVQINKQLVEVLREAKKDAPCEYVVCHGGHAVKSIDKGFREAAKTAGLKDVTPHTLRHSAAVWMAEAGIPMAEIAQFLGHSNMNTTFRVYARFSPDHLSTAAAALEVN